MKLPVTNVRPVSSPESLWARFADVLFDHALATGEETTADGVRSVGGDDAISRRLPGLALLPTPAGDDVLAGYLTRCDATATAWPRFVQADEAYFRDAFTARRFRPQPMKLLRLRASPPADVAVAAAVILPARAAAAKYEAWCVARSANEPMATLLPRHLDDPQYEGILALRDGAPVAAIGLQCRGQTGLIADLFVRPDARRGGLAALLIGRAIEMAARSQMVDVFAAVAADDAPALRLFDRCAFAIVRDFVEWLPPAIDGR